MGMVDKVETTIGFRVQGEVEPPPCNSGIISRNVRGPYIIQGVHLNHSLFFISMAIAGRPKDYLSNPPTPYFEPGRRPVHPADRPFL